MTTARSLVLLAAALLAWTPSARASEMRRYSITDLGAFPGQSQSIATGINNNGQVVGFSYSTRYDGTYTGAWKDVGRRNLLR